MTKTRVKIKNPNSPQIKAYASAVRKGLKSQHVVPKENSWAVKKLGVSRPSKVFDTQKKAINYGRKIAKKNKVDLFIHKSNGRIKSRETYF